LEVVPRQWRRIRMEFIGASMRYGRGIRDLPCSR
jgi:hypothetical protein